MEGHYSSKRSILLFFGTILFLVLCSIPDATKAAGLYLSPSFVEDGVGRSFSLTVGVSSTDRAANAVSGTVSFSTDKLEVANISTSGSIVGLWVKEPSFSNTIGTVRFEGVVLNPGFKGNAGKIMAINFKTKAAGIATATLSSGAVLANDGKATNITSELGRFTATIKGLADEPAPITPLTTTPGMPSAPIVTSLSHPDNNAWYNKNIADLHWTMASMTKGARTSVDQNPDTVPLAAFDASLDSYSTERLNDGVWYFHICIKNTIGWGPTAHFRLQIDTAPPENFHIQFPGGNQMTDPRPKVEFNTTDLSGIDRYEIKAGDGEVLVVKAAELINDSYSLPIQQPGTRRLLAIAVDKAGNRSSTSEDFTILALNTPTIDKYPAQLNVGEPLVARGITDYPDTSVMVWLQRDGGELTAVTVRTDAKGAFVYMSDDKMSAGIYKLWAQVSDKQGGISAPSDKITVVVEKPAWLMFAGREVGLWWLVLLVSALLSINTVAILKMRPRSTDVNRHRKRFNIK